MTADRSNNPWLFDLRLRERNLRNGSLDEKELSRHLGALTDVEADAESFAVAQPALDEPIEEAVEESAAAPVTTEEVAPAPAAVAAPAPVESPAPEVSNGAANPIVTE